MASLPNEEMYQHAPYGAQPEQTLPREALAGEPPAIEALIISWKPDAWKWLRVMKDYVKNNPDDYISKKIYRNFVNWYKTCA